MSPIFRTILGWVTVAIVIFTIATYLVAMALSVILVWGTTLGSDLAALNLRGLPPLGAFFFYFRFSSVPISINLLGYVAFCIIVFAACFVAGFRSRGGFLESLRNLTKSGRLTRTSNWLVVMPLVSTGLLVVVVVLTSLLAISGVPSGSLCKPGVDCPSIARLFAGLAHAPIGEEIAFRILTPLGLIFPARIAWRRFTTGKGPSTLRFLSIIGDSLISPEHAKGRTGYRNFASNGWKGIQRIEWVFIIVSATTFGLAHVQNAGGTDWGWGKLVTAAVSGAVLAFVYIAFGAFATILLHWFFDFYVEVLALSFPVSGGLTPIVTDLVIFGGLFLIGIFSIFVGSAWLAKKVIHRISPTTYKPPETISFSVQ